MQLGCSRANVLDERKNAINSTLQPMNDNIHGRTLTRTYLVRKAINIYQSFLSHYFSGLPCLLFYMGASQILGLMLLIVNRYVYLLRVRIILHSVFEMIGDLW